MTDNYYLINGHIKFCFDIESQFIEYKGSKESLEPKESQILKYVLENQEDGFIKSETILDNNWDYWSDKKVLQKVLSTLRRKFKNIGVTENGFVATGSNYKINFQGIIVDSNDQQKKEKNALANKVVHSTKTAIIWALAGAITLFAYIKFNEKPHITIDNIYQATAISGLSVDPALSPDGSALAFTHKTENSSQIYLKVDSNLDYYALTSGHNDKLPAWSPSGRQLAFQRVGDKSCELRVIRLDAEYKQVGSDNLLTNCNQYTYLSRITWESEDTLFFTDKQKLDGPTMIKHLKISDKKVTDYFSYKDTDNYTGSGQYYIVYNKKLEKLFSLDSPDWEMTNINIVHENNILTKIRQVGDILLSIDIFNNHIIFKDIDNQLKAFTLGNSNNLVTIYKNPLKPIGYPIISTRSNNIAIVSGSFFRNDIFSMDLKSHVISEVISSQFKLRTPQEVGKEILFTSFETGIYQIYSYNNNIQTQLTNFTKNKKIIHFSMSKDKRWLAVNFIDGTVLYKRHSNGLTAIKSFPLMTFPAFSLDSKRILLKNLVRTKDSTNAKLTGDGIWKEELTEFSLEDFSPTGITIKSASFGVYHQNGIIFIASGKDEINMFKLNGVSLLYKGEAPLVPSNFAVNDKYLFIGYQDHAIKVEIETNIQSQLPSEVKDQITANNDSIYFKNEQLGNMVIFRGELSAN